MTFGRSTIVEEFFKKAAETRTFEVIVAEGGPFLNVIIIINTIKIYNINK